MLTAASSPVSITVMENGFRRNNSDSSWKKADYMCSNFDRKMTFMQDINLVVLSPEPCQSKTEHVKLAIPKA